MNGLGKGVSYNFGKHFKVTPAMNRLKLIKPAEGLLEVKKAGRENTLWKCITRKRPIPHRERKLKVMTAIKSDAK